MLLVALTSQIPAPQPPNDILLSLDDLRTGGLPKATLARPTKLITIHQALIRRGPGRISDGNLQSVLSRLRSFLS